MTDTDRLAALLAPMLPQHNEGTASHPPHPGDRTWTAYDWMTPEDFAARLIAAGVTLAPTPPDALRDAARLTRAVKHLAFGGGSDAVSDAEQFDVGFLSFGGESSAEALAAAIAREYAALEETP